MKTSRLDLINPKSDFNKLWVDYIEDFGDNDDLIVVVQGNSQEIITPVLDELSQEIQKYPKLFSSVLGSVDTTPMLRKGLHFIDKKEKLEKIQHFVQQMSPVIQGHWETVNLNNYLGKILQQLAFLKNQNFVQNSNESVLCHELLNDSLRELDAFSGSFLDILSPSPTGTISPLPPIVEMGTLKREYFIADQGQLGVVLLKINESKEGSFTYGTQSIEKLREIIHKSQEKHPEAKIGLTGLTVMENDEMRMSQIASTKAGILSFLGVTIIFIAAFGGFRHPLLAVFALMIGFAWTMGFVVWSIGHLNILSMSFGVILIGLGIDFGIHYISKYLENRKKIRSPGEAILQAAQTVGPGVFVGALTTSSAFFILGQSEFTGIAELGLISSGGILCCCLAAIVIIPAMIQLVDGNRPMKPLPLPVDICWIIAPIFRFPKMVLFVSLIGTLLLATGLPSIWYDHNLLNLQPEYLESVELEKELLKKWDKGAWFALSIAESPEELLKRKEEFEKDPTLKVDEIVSRFPTTSPEKQAMIDSIAQLLNQLPETTSPIPICDPIQLGNLLDQLAFLVESLPVTLLDDSNKQEYLWRINQICSMLRRLTAVEYQRRIEMFQQFLAGELLNRLYLIRFCAASEPPELNDLPESLVSRYVGQKSGKYLMRIYSTTEIWSMEHLQEFIAKVKKVDPYATGNPIQTYEASLQMQRSYQKSTVWAFLVILVLIYLDFRSVKYTLMVLLPLILGILQGFGLLGLLNIPLNPANAIVIPLILGIGIDDGIHLIHHYRLQTGTFKMPVSLANSIVITTLTTIIGFGTLMIADHRGLQSLGRVLVIGISACTFSSLIIMPAFLAFLSRNRTSSAETTK